MTIPFDSLMDALAILTVMAGGALAGWLLRGGWDQSRRGKRR